MTVGLIKDFSAICDFIDKHRKNGGVLIHCRAGRSRSATAVIAYLMKSNKWGSEKGYEEVRKLRRIMPNWGFREQLEVWEKVEYNIFMDGKSKEEYREWLRIRKERLDLKDLTGDKPICMQCV